jgi:Rieske Fe-S protein
VVEVFRAGLELFGNAAVSNRGEGRARPSFASRRTLIRVAGWSLFAPVAVLFGTMLDRYTRTTVMPRRVELPPDLPEGVSFIDEVIVARSAGELRVFSARCTHLGCLIARTADDLLVCPCHGSRFHLDGRVANGPAPRPLRSLPYEKDVRTGALVVHVS